MRPCVSPERGPALDRPQSADTPVHQCGDGGGRAPCPFRWAAPAPHHRQAPTARHAALPPAGEGKGMTQPRPTRRRGRRFRWETTARALADGRAPSSATALCTRGRQLSARPTGARGSRPRGPAPLGKTVGGRGGGAGGCPKRGCPAGSVERPRLDAGPRRRCRPTAAVGVPAALATLVPDAARLPPTSPRPFGAGLASRIAWHRAHLPRALLARGYLPPMETTASTHLRGTGPQRGARGPTRHTGRPTPTADAIVPRAATASPSHRLHHPHLLPPLGTPTSQA